MKLLLTGAQGQVGHALLQLSSSLGHTAVGLDMKELDITDKRRVLEVTREHKPDVLINAAAYTAVDKAETETDAAYAVNRDGAAHLALACNRCGIPFIHLSTDYVFDGASSEPYGEDAPARPLSVYGASKLAGEQEVRRLCPSHLILRTSWVFSARGGNFVKTMLRLGKERSELGVVADQFGCPTPAEDIAAVILHLAQTLLSTASPSWGTYHYCGRGTTNWHGFSQAIFAKAREFDSFTFKKLKPISTAEFPTLARRPANSVLACKRIRQVFGIEQRPWIAGLHKVIEEIYA